MTLPVTVPFHDDETPLSLASRLAIANGYRSLADFLHYTYIRHTAIRRGEENAMANLSEWSGVPVNKLARYAASRKIPTWRLGNAVFSSSSRCGYRQRFCAACLRADFENGEGRPESRAYARASWQVGAFSACTIHNCTLSELKGTRDDDGDFSRLVWANKAEILNTTPTSASPQALRVSEYITARLVGATSNDFLDSLQAYVALDMCTYLGHFAKKHQIVEQSMMSAPDMEVGFDIARNGLRAVTKACSEAVSKAQPRHNGHRHFFRRIWVWLYSHKDKADFKPVVDIFQGIAEYNFPLGPHDVFLLKSGPQKVHSLKSAAAKWGMSSEHVRTVLEDAGLIEKSKLTPAYFMFDAVKADEILGNQAAAMTVQEVSREWGLPIDRVRTLIRNGFLPSLPRSGRRGITIMLPRDKFKDIKKRVDGPKVSSDELQGWTRVTDVKSYGRSLDGVLELIRTKKLAAVRCGGDELRHLWVKRTDLFEKTSAGCAIKKVRLPYRDDYGINARIKKRRKI